MSIRPFAARQIPIEEEIEAVVTGQASLHPLEYAPPDVRQAVVVPAVLPLPDYITHLADVSEIGKLSAEAVARDYESAAKGIESMGDELMERVRQCEAMAQRALEAIEEMKATAAKYREEGKRLFNVIEAASLATDQVRATCTALADRIANP